MTLTLQSAAILLNEHHLLREIITPDQWTMNPVTVEKAALFSSVDN